MPLAGARPLGPAHEAGGPPVFRLTHQVASALAAKVRPRRTSGTPWPPPFGTRPCLSGFIGRVLRDSMRTAESRGIRQMCADGEYNGPSDTVRRAANVLSLIQIHRSSIGPVGWSDAVSELCRRNLGDESGVRGPSAGRALDPKHNRREAGGSLPITHVVRVTAWPRPGGGSVSSTKSSPW